MSESNNETRKDDEHIPKAYRFGTNETMAKNTTEGSAPAREMELIEGLMCVQDTQKAWGVIFTNKIAEHINPAMAKTGKEVKDVLFTKLIWIPKSRAELVDYTDITLFPVKIYPSAYSPVHPLSSVMKLKVEKWLANKFKEN